LGSVLRWDLQGPNYRSKTEPKEKLSFSFREKERQNQSVMEYKSDKGKRNTSFSNTSIPYFGFVIILNLGRLGRDYVPTKQK